MVFPRAPSRAVVGHQGPRRPKGRDSRWPAGPAFAARTEGAGLNGGREELVGDLGHACITSYAKEPAPGAAANTLPAATTNRARPEWALLTSLELDLSEVASRPARLDAVTLLTCYVLLLMLIPSTLVLTALGSAGSPATMLALLLMCWYLVTWMSPATIPRRSQPVRVAGILFLCVIVASYISANRHIMSTIEQDGADNGIILVVGWIGILLLAADGIANMERLRVLLSRIVAAATVMAGLAITQFFTGINIASHIVIPGLSDQNPFVALNSRADLNRPSATALTPIELAAVLAICLPIAIHMARFAPGERRGRRWTLVMIIGIALPLTLSRTAFTALAALALVILPTWPKRDRRIAYLACLAAIGVIYITAHGVIGTITSLFSGIFGDSSTQSRSSAFSLAEPFITQHPWLGTGFNTFFPQTTFFTDDQYLNSLLSTGIIGLIALLTLFVTGWVTARSARRLIADQQGRDLAQSLAAAVAACAVSFVSLDSFSFAIISGVTFLVLGCTAALWRLTRIT